MPKEIYNRQLLSGHRVKALEYVGKAITETNKGIAAGSN
jgi:hypothetical protein